MNILPGGQANDYFPNFNKVLKRQLPKIPNKITDATRTKKFMHLQG